MIHIPKEIQVVQTDSNFEREKLVRPFGFKGGYLTELWQTVASMESESGNRKIGLATQSVLYGDADLFAAHSESSGNALMYILAEQALQIVRKTPFDTPINLLDKILPEVMEEGKKLTGKSDLNPNFVYNALISVDNAAWLLYAAEHQYHDFETMIPEAYRAALSHRNNRIAIMYQVPYGMPVEEIQQAVQQGYFVIKIKMGQPGSESEMLQKDMDRLTQIHAALKDMRTRQTADEKLIYTLDANGRYEKKETIQRFIDHAKKIGALDQILLFEEPLSEKNQENVADVGVRIAADESIHDEADALKRLEQGYGAFVLKGIAKTLSLSMKTAKLAYEKNIPCLCADLTVNPILMSWHQNLAAHLPPFPGLEDMGMMETNGDMNYVNWKTMLDYHPKPDASWLQRKNGVFELNREFYQHSGGIFDTSDHYEKMMRKPV
ncbi:enolase C-terminal domain-like protein [Catalinimonas niigatensis]|uniref:enolase C-terminal domain-like protein n=1 Tax=Catalinimonas niigatensis TaxID=1397264 RepID=UPI002666498E|nr:enolase C-terminal domain-like protein [Catalinimonas niigatensis]WPP50970.1 enolase C-terminal domain-like protein [Catalinimonas niigatensis]